MAELDQLLDAVDAAPSAEPLDPLSGLVEGLATGLTSPLGIVGGAYHPAYGPAGPRVAGTVGELVGSIIPFILGEGVISRFVPALRGTELIPRAARSAATFGALEAGRENVPGQSRAERVVAAAISGGVLGAGLAPGVGKLRAAASGAASSLVPLAFGQETHSPVSITGNERVDSAAFNGVVAAVLSMFGGKVRDSAPDPFAPDMPSYPSEAPTVAPGPVGGEVIPSRPVRVPTAPRQLRLPFGRISSDGKIPPLVDIIASTQEGGPVVTERAMRQLRLPFGREPRVQSIPADVRPVVPPGDAIDKLLEPIPSPVKAPEVAPPTSLADAIDTEVQKRSPDPIVKSSRNISLSEDALQRIKAIGRDIPGVSIETGQLVTGGMKVSELKTLADYMSEIGESEASRQLRAVARGASGGRGVKRVGEAPAKARITEVAPGAPLDEVVDRAESADLLSQDIQDRVRQVVERQIVERHAREKAPVLWNSENEVAPKTYTYKDRVRLATEKMLVPGLTPEGKPTLRMPDQSVMKFESEREAIEYLAKYIPPTTEAPVYAGPEQPPIAQTYIPATFNEYVRQRTGLEPKDLSSKETDLLQRAFATEQAQPAPKDAVDNVLMQVDDMVKQHGQFSVAIPEAPADFQMKNAQHNAEGFVSPNKATLETYAADAVGGPVESVSLIGSTAAKGVGHDVDVLYHLRPVELPASSQEASQVVTNLVENSNVDLTMRGVDHFFDVNGRRFVLRSGAGREITEIDARPSPEQVLASQLGGPEVMKAVGLTPEDLKASLAKEKRTDAFARAKQTIREIGATADEAAKLTGGQAETIASLPKELAAEQANEILQQIRKPNLVDLVPKDRQLEVAQGEASTVASEVIPTKSVDGAPQLTVENPLTNETTNVKTPQEAIVAAKKGTPSPARSFTKAELQSLFRRRFAAASDPGQRNAIRVAYKKYSDFFDMRPLLPGETPLKSLRKTLNPSVLPEIDLTPPGVPPVSLPPGMHPAPPTPSNPPGWAHIDVDGLKRLDALGYIRTVKPLMLDIESKSRGIIPAYSKIFLPLSENVERLSVFRRPYLEQLATAWKLAGKDAGERVGLYLEADNKAAAIAQYGVKPNEVKAADMLRDMWNKLWVDFKFNEKGIDFVKNYLPKRRVQPDMNKGSIRKILFNNRALPSDVDFWAQFERVGGEIDVRERDAFKLFTSYLYSGSRANFTRADINASVTLIQGLQLPSALEPLREHMALFVKRVDGMPDSSIFAVNQAIGTIAKRLGLSMDGKSEANYVAQLMQLGVGANIAWRVPTVMRNSFQIMFPYPLLGARYFSKGLSAALTKAGFGEAVADGVITKDFVAFGDEIFNPLGSPSTFTRAGTKLYRKIDDLTRVVGYLGTKYKVMDSALRWKQGLISLDSLVKETELTSMLHPTEAKVVLDMIKSGRIDEAAKLAGNMMQQNTNFMYASFNSPRAFRSVAGRFFGQYGMWPASYIEYAGYLARFGTQAERAAKISRFIALNTAFGLVGTMLGANFWKWVMFGPMVFTGGPMFQTLIDASKVAESAVSGKKTAEGEIAKSHLMRTGFGVTNVLPGSGAGRDILRVEEALRTKGLGAAVTTMFTGQIPESGGLNLAPQEPTQSNSIDDLLKGL